MLTYADVCHRCGAPEPAVTEPTKAVRDSDICYKTCCYSKWSVDPALVEQHVKQEEGKSEVCLSVCRSVGLSVSRFFLYLHWH